MKVPSVMFTFLTLLTATIQRSYHESPSYVGAIVEYSPVIGFSDDANLGELNTNNYLKIIEKAASYDVDIIVFPESTLSLSLSSNATIRRSQEAAYIPDPIENIIPCDNESQLYTYSLKSISCAAKMHQMYILINHKEKVDCTPGEGCPADGLSIYNTNVVFDRDGQVISRYRKYHLFGEPDKNVTEPIATTFKTDFGVTFGTFICFDLNFETPALNLTRDLGVTDILFPAFWFSEMPFLFGVEAQAAWAYANNVNLLASGANYPETGSGGSGIYLGKEGYAKVISEPTKKSNILVVAEIPKVINGKRTQNINSEKVHVYGFNKDEIDTGEDTASEEKITYKRDHLAKYTTKLIDLRQKIHDETICDQDFCCNFKLNIDFNENIADNNFNYYKYRFAVFNGTRTYSGYTTGGVQNCGIISCINNTLESCGPIFQVDQHIVHPTTFVSLEIATANVTSENTFFMPITFSQSLIPLNVTDFDYELVRIGEHLRPHMKLKKPLKKLLTFSIYGRNFALDGTEATRRV